MEKNMYRIPCIPITSLLVVPLKELSKLRNIEWNCNSRLFVFFMQPHSCFSHPFSLKVMFLGCKTWKINWKWSWTKDIALLQKICFHSLCISVCRLKTQTLELFVLRICTTYQDHGNVVGRLMFMNSIFWQSSARSYQFSSAKLATHQVYQDFSAKIDRGQFNCV